MTRRRTVGAFLLLSAVWGTAFMVTEVGLWAVPPTLLAALRFDLATLLLFGYVAVRRLPWRPTGRDWYPLLVGGALLIGVHHAFLFAGQVYVSSAVAAVLLGLIPVVTPALTRLTDAHERLAPSALVGIAVGFVGVVVIADPNPANLVADVRGVALVLASALAFALGAVATHGRTPALPAASEQAWMMLVGSLVLHASAAVLGEPFPTTWSLETVGALVYLSAVAGVGGFLLYFRLLDSVGPVETSLLEYVIPVFAALAGWLALGESLSATTVVGFLCIVCGFLLVKGRALRAALRHRRRERPTGVDADPADD